jgi:hypothetical protein
VVVEVGDEIAWLGVAGDEPGQIAGRHAAPAALMGGLLEP